ncbi:MAG: PrpF family protein [SAR324 cluster bacterium]|nr:PrpF family protein [SAR324 cluster bacterium]
MQRNPARSLVLKAGSDKTQLILKASMTQIKIPAVYMRGGSSKGVFFHAKDLPVEAAARDRLFLQVLGSPDSYQRQLDGMGGGLSSVSKAVIIEPSNRPEADIDYTFAQVAVNRPIVDYSATCGNLSSAVGPFAVDEGLLGVEDGKVTVRVYNTNTSKIFHAHFVVENKKAKVKGNFQIPGVSGTGAKIQLDFLDPGGSAAPTLLPTQSVQDNIDIKGLGQLQVSLVDATNPVVFVRAADLACSGMESPETLEANSSLMGTLDEIRRKSGVLMKLAESPDKISLANPKIGLVGNPSDFKTIDGVMVSQKDVDISIRMLSMEKIHRAVPLTSAMCLATACKITGSIPHQLALQSESFVRIGNPSGVLPVGADVIFEENNWQVNLIKVYRTARRLMEGSVLVPEE